MHILRARKVQNCPCFCVLVCVRACTCVFLKNFFFRPLARSPTHHLRVVSERVRESETCGMLMVISCHIIIHTMSHHHTYYVTWEWDLRYADVNRPLLPYKLVSFDTYRPLLPYKLVFLTRIGLFCHINWPLLTHTHTWAFWCNDARERERERERPQVWWVSVKRDLL